MAQPDWKTLVAQGRAIAVDTPFPSEDELKIMENVVPPVVDTFIPQTPTPPTPDQTQTTTEMNREAIIEALKAKNIPFKEKIGRNEVKTETLLALLNQQ